MKSLNQYITEAVKFDVIKNQYREYGVVTLVRRENVDCASLSKDDFIKLMTEDLTKAVEEYETICNKLNDEKRKEVIEREMQKAIAFAEQKYKTQRGKDKYIENARKNAGKMIYLLDPKQIFFDFKPDKGEFDGGYTIKANGDYKDQLSKCYDVLVKSKYFKKGIGWAFKYESNTKDKIGTFAFRPYIDLLVDETTHAEQERDKERLAQSVNDFYSKSNYWGD